MKDIYGPIHKLAMVRITPGRCPEQPPTSFSIKDILGAHLNPLSRQVLSAVAFTRALPRARIGIHRPNHIRNDVTKIVRPWDSVSTQVYPAHRLSSLSSREISSRGLSTQIIESDSDSEEEIVVDDDVTSRKTSFLTSVSPLDALLEMTSKTFRGLEHDDDRGDKRNEAGRLFGKQPPKKKRKSRTAFTNHQIYELEKRFLYQKYLTPADRDDIAQSLGLSNAQVITWFQNRRAKLKRDLEELKNDVTATTKIVSSDNDETRD